MVLFVCVCLRMFVLYKLNINIDDECSFYVFFRWTRQGTEKNLHKMGQQAPHQGMSSTSVGLNMWKLMFLGQGVHLNHSSES